MLINLILLKSTPPSMNFTSSALFLSLKQMYVHSEQSWLVMIFYFLIIFIDTYFNFHIDIMDDAER